MLTKEKLQKMAIKGKKEGLKAVAKKEKELKRYDEKLLKKFKKWITYMMTEAAKGGARQLALPINRIRWNFVSLEALEQAKLFLEEHNLVYSIKPDISCPTDVIFNIPVVIIIW